METGVIINTRQYYAYKYDANAFHPHFKRAIMTPVTLDAHMACTELLSQRRTLLKAGFGSLGLGMSLALLPSALWAADAPRARAAAGRYVGQYVRAKTPPNQNVAQFLGLRYGLDTRRTRFQRPVAAPAQVRTQQSTQYGPACPQRSESGHHQSEDCLFLNVWTPQPGRTANRRALPVLVYIHGGAYSNGASSDPLTHGATLAADAEAVVVTLNHRLNCFGYLSLARWSSDFPDSGNAGQWDLVLALKWVQRNIDAFGGDPNNVTVFGQSGGGAKIATLMAMPAAAGLFHKAMTMSGQQVTASGPLNATRRAKCFLEATKLSLAQLQSASTKALLQGLEAVDPILGGSLYFGPVLDMAALTRHPFWPDAAPQSLGIPMIMGNTICETRAFFPDSHPTLQKLDWHNLAERIEPELRVDIAPEWVIAQYRARFPHFSAHDVFFAATTASRSWRGQVLQAQARALAGAPAYVYQLNFERAKHTDDIGLVFGTFTPATKARAGVSRQMMDHFKQFIRSGDPGWPAYTLAQRATMIFDTRSRVQNNPRAWERELFARIPYIQPGS